MGPRGQLGQRESSLRECRQFGRSVLTALATLGLQMDTLRRLREAGIGIAIDDFGTGYSSLSYLQQFEFDALKIDRSFLPTDEVEQGWDVVKMIINLAHDKQAAVVAEGVETERQADRLRELECDRVQGYWFAKPLDIEAATERLRQEMGR